MEQQEKWMLFLSACHFVFIIIVIGSGQCYKDNAPSLQYIPLRNANLSFSRPLNDFANAAAKEQAFDLARRAKKSCAENPTSHVQSPRWGKGGDDEINLKDAKSHHQLLRPLSSIM